MITLQFITLISVALMLVVSILMQSRMRLKTLVFLLQVQGALVALYAAATAAITGEASLYIIAAAILAIKVGVMPWLLVRGAHVRDTSERLRSYLRPTSATIIAVLVTVLACVVAIFAVPIPEASSYVAMSFSIISLGLMLLITRRGMFGQSVGFLVLENGVYVLGLAITHGSPLFVEAGTLFDLTVLFVLILGLMRRSQSERSSLDTDTMRELVD